ncbi:cupredoxin domain-containing protein [Ilumatobacter coccineus]|uniref:Putative blue copper protein n=1 Tax=Ilumatobacter coccineus (strain NBRC 103263 / KCTC 29153 / YM16-304) TaxID=1313172 RepID=A0A6C7ECD9_ILUCY|nr:cupredoxin domain-containing protein [Ilumatobacter coccineus]BAN04040.1 putative blue copper protein [Ilumatobacter coccineus YM16-304]
MALRTTPTIAVCLAAGLAAGIALARPADGDEPQAAAPATTSLNADASADTVTDPYGGLADAVDGTGAGAPPASGPAASITIEGFAFSGPPVVAAGSTIEVTNLDGAPHTLTADDGSFDTGDLAQNDVGVIAAPATPGTYSFVCAIHPSMTGSITVE